MTKYSDYTTELKLSLIKSGKFYLELSVLGPHTVQKVDFGEAIRVTISNENYDIYIEGPYPFQAPRLYKVPNGLFFQGDLLEKTLKLPWGPGLTLSDIISGLPCPDQGKYHLGSTFPMYLFPGLSYSCVALQPKSYKPWQKIKFLITENHIFQIQSFNENSGHLVAYGTFESIKYVKVSKVDRKRFSIEWRGPVGKLQVFFSEDCEEIVNGLLKIMNSKGIKTLKVKQIESFIHEDEVSPQFMMKVKIGEIEAEIIEIELELEHELEKNKINSLIELYQKAIEYFSALGHDKFDAYLAKIRNLMGNSEVMAVLMEETHVAVVIDERLTKEFEDQEVWPTNFAE